MCLEPLEHRDIPRGVCLEQFYHVSLQVPNNDLRLEVAVRLTRGMSLVGTLRALLELVA